MCTISKNFALLIVFGQVFVISGLKILFLVMPQLLTHRKAIIPLAETLQAKGHQVTIAQIALREIGGLSGKLHEEKIFWVKSDDRYLLDGWVHQNLTASANLIWTIDEPTPITTIFPWISTGELCQLLMEQDKIDLDWVLTKKWDLIVVSSQYATCSYAITSLSKSPYLLFVPSVLDQGANYMIGYPNVGSIYPSTQSPVQYEPKTFWKRIRHGFDYYLELFLELGPFKWVINHSASKLNPDFSMNTFVAKADGIVTDYIQRFDYPRPYSATYIQAGTYCKKNPKPLPSVLENFVSDRNSRGTIYIAFGSIVKWSYAPAEKARAFLEAAKNLPHYRFLWQYSGGDLGELPSNVLVQPWFPQADVLGHAKTKVFVTHGGIKSLREGFCNAIPVVIMPIFAEQYRNAMIIKSRSLGTVISKITVSGQALTKSLNAVISNSKYARNAERFREFFLDELIGGNENAAFWVEFATRHKGFPDKFFKLKSTNLYWFQYYLLDVVFGALLGIICVISILFRQFQKLC